MSNLEFFLEHSESVKGFFWLDTGDHWSIDLEVLSEILDISDEMVDTENEVLLECSLLALQVVSDHHSLLNECLPVLVQD